MFARLDNYEGRTVSCSLLGDDGADTEIDRVYTAIDRGLPGAESSFWKSVRERGGDIKKRVFEKTGAPVELGVFEGVESGDLDRIRKGVGEMEGRRTRVHGQTNSWTSFKIVHKQN